MAFLQSFSINTEKTRPFPFNIPAVQFAKDVILDNRVTIFVGDNGSGKSTLLESLALSLNLPLIGGFIKRGTSFEAARLIHPYLELVWKRNTSKGFFFRAEDFRNFINAAENTDNSVRSSLSELKGVVNDNIIKQMSESANYTLHSIRKQYGDDMQAYSHGEAYLKILQTRIADKGIYLLDEPEAALSPLKQLSLIAYMLDVLKTGNAQFLLATHSPILMGFPGAALYEIQEEEMKQVNYTDTDHYRITKTFLENPDFYLRHL
jgi:predicted ATPase